MGWEKRGRHLYYYTKQRKGRQVVSKYVAAPLAQAAAILDAEARAQRQARRQEQAEVALLAASGANLEALARVLVHLALSDAGYRKHKGQWRKRRHGQAKSTSTSAPGRPVRGVVPAD